VKAGKKWITMGKESDGGIMDACWILLGDDSNWEDRKKIMEELAGGVSQYQVDVDTFLRISYTTLGRSDTIQRRCIF
jgi:hypothetical protein